MIPKKFLLIIFITGFYFQLFAQSTSQSLVDKFFIDYNTKGAKIAVEEIYKTNRWTSKIQDQIIDIKTKLEGYNEELVGKYYGNLLLDKTEFKDSFAIYSYILKFDRQPLRLTFKLYKPNDTWVLYSFSFDDTLDEDLEKAIILKYTHKE